MIMGTLKRKSEEDAGAPPKVAKSSETNSLEIVNEQQMVCVHDVSYPEGYVPSQSSSAPEASEPAKKFPFNLDPFQSEAIKCIENGESVMVSNVFLIFFSSDFCLEFFELRIVFLNVKW